MRLSKVKGKPKYEVIFGERRWRACQLANVPFKAIVRDLTDSEAALLQIVENEQRQDLSEYAIGSGDIVVGIAASGTTPYVVNGLLDCKKKGIITGCITCNPNSPLAEAAELPVEVVVGPEYVTGSTRMKSGTAQKLVLNMLTTSVMIKLGRVRDNKMVDMQLSNNKLVDRGTKMIMSRSDLPYDQAKELLLTCGSVRTALKRLS